MTKEAMAASADNDAASPTAKSEGRRGTLLFAIQVGGIALLLGTALVGYARWRTGSMGLVWPYLAGQRLLIEPTQLDLGNVGQGEVVERKLRFLNTGSTPLRILGSQSSCGCITTSDFPVVIDSGKEFHLKFSIAMPLAPGPFEQQVKLFSDDRGYSHVVVTVLAQVRNRPHTDPAVEQRTVRNWCLRERVALGGVSSVVCSR